MIVNSGSGTGRKKLYLYCCTLFIRWVCDGEPDCKNGEDEKNCETGGCDAKENGLSFSSLIVEKNWTFILKSFDLRAFLDEF